MSLWAGLTVQCVRNMKADEHLPIVAREGGQGQYSVSIFEGWLGSGGWAAGNLEDSMMTSCLL